MRRLIFILSFLSSFMLSMGQDPRGHNWYFGDKASVTFNTNPITSLTNSRMYQREGVSSISDRNGNLLFYTNGRTVWDKNHNVMPNGMFLLGHNSSTSSALIVPSPISDEIFYIFTTEGVERGRNGLRYNIVNMTKNNGLGDVTVKNQLLLDRYTEKLSAVYSKDKSKIYVITKVYGNNEYYVYELNPNLNITPKVYNGVFVPSTRNDRIGVLKFFAGGTKFANAYYESGILEIGDFNPETGQMGNIDTLDIFPGLYGLEFSPNGEYLYISTVTTPSYLLQMNLESKVIRVISQRNQIQDNFGALQVGVDGKIYVVEDLKDYVSVIQNPNAFFQSSQFTRAGVELSDSTLGEIGLPNLPQTFYYKYGISNNRTICEGDGTFLSVWTDTQNNDTTSKYTWYHPNGAIVSSKRTYNMVNAQLDDGGIYRCVIENMTGIFELEVEIFVKPKHTAEFNYPDTLKVCDEDFILLSLSLESELQDYEILWSNGITDKQIQINQTGNYSVNVKDVTGCYEEDFSVYVLFNELDYDGIETIVNNICFDNEVSLIPNIEGNYTLRWYDSNGNTLTTQDTLKVSESDMYYVEITSTETDCIIIDSVYVEMYKFESNPIYEDNVDICFGESYLIQTSLDSIGTFSYLWNTGQTEKSITVDETGLYSVKITDAESGCIIEDSIFVNVIDPRINFDESIISIEKYYNETFRYDIGLENVSNIKLKYGEHFTLLTKTEIAFISDNKYGEFNDTIIVTNRIGNCEVEYKKPIKVVNRGIVYLELTSTKAKVGDTVCIDLNFFTDLDNLEYFIKFAYNKNLFYPINEKESYTKGDKLCGIVLLGSGDKTALEVDSVATSNKYIDVIITNGELTIDDICIKDKRLILLKEKTKIEVYPNPVREDILKIKYKSVDVELQFNLIDYSGKLVWNKTVNSSDSQYFQEITVNTNTLSSGVYYLIVYGDKSFYNNKIIIHK